MSKRRKITAQEMAAIMAQQTVGEIVESDVTEVAAVDRPATGKEWRFFKAVGDGPIPQPAGLTNYRTCLEAEPQSTPTLCEAGGGEPDARGSLVDALTADMAGHDATMADAKMLRDAEEALQGKATFDECVQSVMSKPGFEPQGDHSPEESARAICATKPGGPQEGKMITRGQKCPGPVGKDAALDELPPPPMADDLMPMDDMPEEPETIEIPSKPTALGLGECITEAQDMGLPEQVASDACDVLRADFGDPTDEMKLLVPDGTTIEGLINAAALKLGAAKSLKVAPSAADRQIKLTGRSYWRVRVRKFLGLDDPRPGVKLAAYLQARDARVEAFMAEQTKGRADTDRRMDQLITLLAGAIGVELPAVGAASAVPEPSPAPAGDPPPASNPLFNEPSKSQKDGAAAGAPVPAAPTIEERMARFEAVLAQVLQQLQAPAPIEDEEDEDMPDMVGAGAGPAAANAPAPLKRVSQPAPLIKSGMVNRFAGAKAAGDTVASTIFGGLAMSRAEREAAAANGGGLPRFARK